MGNLEEKHDFLTKLAERIPERFPPAQATSIVLIAFFGPLALYLPENIPQAFKVYGTYWGALIGVVGLIFVMLTQFRENRKQMAEMEGRQAASYEAQIAERRAQAEQKTFADARRKLISINARVVVLCRLVAVLELQVVPNIVSRPIRAYAAVRNEMERLSETRAILAELRQASEELSPEIQVELFHLFEHTEKLLTYLSILDADHNFYVAHENTGTADMHRPFLQETEQNARVRVENSKPIFAEMIEHLNQETKIMSDLLKVHTVKVQKNAGVGWDFVEVPFNQ